MKRVYRLGLICIMLLGFCGDAFAQMRVQNMADHDAKPYYFGLTFGFNMATYRIRYTEAYALTDTFKTIQPHWGPGFTLGLMGNLRLHKYVDLRTVPSLQFAEKRLDFNTPLGDSLQKRTVESIYFTFPVQFKFKSDRIRNFRFYAIGGGKIDYDLASNAKSRKQNEFLKIKPFDAGYELGVGFEFYYPNFIFSPEIKLSQGLVDQIYRDKNLPLTNAIESITTRTIVISIHLEG
ncbi:MAG: PorT family protein [Bacteroidetes bacterium]|nr:PorT family protein [Bacteroidota bacterium]